MKVILNSEALVFQLLGVICGVPIVFIDPVGMGKLHQTLMQYHCTWDHYKHI